MDAANLHKLLVQIETVLNGDFLALLMGYIHDASDEISCIRSIRRENFLNKRVERVDAVTNQPDPFQQT